MKVKYEENPFQDHPHFIEQMRQVLLKDPHMDITDATSGAFYQESVAVHRVYSGSLPDAGKLYDE